MKKNEISTNNKGVLEIIEPFNLLRGIENENITMGKAKDKKGNIYDIYPAPCDIDTCFCWATALIVKK